jgi:hypothetical protein
MKLEGRVLRGHLLLQIDTVERTDPGKSLTQQLEVCLVDLCHKMEVPIPLWLKKTPGSWPGLIRLYFLTGSSPRR